MSTKTLQTFLYSSIIVLSFSKKEMNIIQVQTKFGERGTGCIGGGSACAIDTPTNKTRSQYDAFVNVYLTPYGKVVFELLKTSISVSKAEEQFGTSFFEREEEFHLCSALKIKSNSFVIKKGHYPITETREHYRIVF